MGDQFLDPKFDISIHYASFMRAKKRLYRTVDINVSDRKWFGVDQRTNSGWGTSFFPTRWTENLEQLLMTTDRYQSTKKLILIFSLHLAAQQPYTQLTPLDPNLTQSHNNRTKWSNMIWNPILPVSLWLTAYLGNLQPVTQRRKEIHDPVILLTSNSGG